MSYCHAHLSIADIRIAIQASDWTWEFDPDARHPVFASPCDPGRDGHDEASLRLFVGPPPPIGSATLLFDAGGQKWRLYGQGERRILEVYACSRDQYPFRLGILTSGFESGDLYVTPRAGVEPPFPYPLLFPVEQLILLELLARGRGVLLHGGAVVDGAGRAFLFVGSSGAGKSTLARLWLAHRGGTLLNDDQTVVRRMGGEFVVYGTPWGGEVGQVSPRGAPLRAIFFLHHAPRNAVTPARPADAASRLLVQSFPSFYDPAGMAFSLKFLGDLVKEVPCYDLDFVPDAGAVELIGRVG